MEYIGFPPEWVADFKEFLEPVGKGSDADIAEMERWFNLNNKTGERSLINVYWCKAGHDTITIDNHLHDHLKTIRCATCRDEARSMHYMVDQSLKPYCEFYMPKDILAYPRHQQPDLRNGIPAFKRIVDPEEVRFSKKIKIKL